MKIIGPGLASFLEANNFTLPAFKQRFPWKGADLQTIRNSFVRQPPLAQISRRLTVSISGGQALSVAVSEPLERVDAKRALLLVHGLGGAEDSAYMELTTHYYVQQGWHVYRMNYRGVGPSAKTSKAPYSAGLTGDMRSVLNAVGADTKGRGFFAAGFSLGGQLLMRTLGEGDVNPALKAVFTVSAPLDLSTSQQKLERPRNAPYIRYLVNNMKRDMLHVDHPSVTSDIGKISTVLDFDDHVIAPFFGFSGAVDYYRCVSCKYVLDRIKVPLVAMHSEDDPWIPVDDYCQGHWPDDAPAGALLLPRGGHVGFHGKGDQWPWYCQVSYTYFGLFN